MESGTAGYLGQVTVIRKGVSECYDCQPKPVQRTYPGLCDRSGNLIARLHNPQHAQRAHTLHRVGEAPLQSAVR